MKPRAKKKLILGARTESGAGEMVQELGFKQGEQDLLEARCLQLEDENRRLKFLVADLTLRNEALKLVVSKKW